MTKNPILDELHAVREQLLADAGGTLDALVDRLQAEEKLSDRARYMERREIPCTAAATPDDLHVENLPPLCSER